MNISTIFEEIGDKRGLNFRLFNILISFNRCLVLKIWYIGIRNYWDICHRQIADGEKIKPSGGVIIFALCLSITSLIITQVEWKRDREKKKERCFSTSLQTFHKSTYLSEPINHVTHRLNVEVPKHIAK